MSTDIVKREAFDLAPVDLKEALEFAALIAKSDLAPRDYKDKPGNVLIAVQMGREVGLAPMQAIQSIAVINGRSSVWGDGALAVVQASGLLEDFCEMSFDEIKRAGYAKCTAIRKGQPTPIERVFSIEDAKSGGMWGRTNRDGSPSVWKAYPYRMLQMRARAFVLRDGFADVLKGLAIREEVQDYVSEVPDSRVINMPRRMSETKVETQSEALPETVDATSTPESIPAPIIDEGGMFDGPPCPTCGGSMRLKPEGIKNGRKYGAFWSCGKYPECKGAVREKEWLAQRGNTEYADSEPEPGLVREPGSEG